ncbi:MAG: murein transglycosylase A [Herminiimonas sp.]|nr:murein transglycosylase A [Herminiimonas sp.]
MSFLRSSVLQSLCLLALLGGCRSIQLDQAAPGAGPIAARPPIAGGAPSPALRPGEMLRATSFAALPGWNQDDLRQAWPAFRASCEVLVKKSEWKEPCSVSRDVVATDLKAVRLFFETFMVPHQVFNPDGSDQGLVTGYYEPLLRGARKRGGIYQTPLYRAPDDLLNIDLSAAYPDLKGMRLRGRLIANKVVPYWTRAELTQADLLAGKELLWVDDPIDAFFLQVQGSGRVQLADGKETVRVSYAEQNGYPYRSIGRYLVDLGELTLEQASAQSIKAWYARHPARQQELLNANPSYVFFKEEKLLDPTKGPKGALGLPLTPQRSIAVDAQFLPLGVPVFLSTTQPNSEVALQRLVMAQDTGGAIKSAVRADFFWGFGAAAGELAGRMKQRGMMWLLLPRDASIASAGR